MASSYPLGSASRRLDRDFCNPRRDEDCYSISVSPEAQATLAAGLQSEFNEVICIMTGKEHSDESLTSEGLKDVVKVDSLAAIDKLTTNE